MRGFGLLHRLVLVCLAALLLSGAVGGPGAQEPGPATGYDVLIVGGGMAGLAAAHYLKDRKVLVLEKEAAVGGKIRREAWQGIAYSRGAAYHVEPYAILGPFLRELGVRPRAVPKPEQSAWVGGRIVPDCWGEGIGRWPFARPARDSFRKAREEGRRILNAGSCTIPDWMSAPEMLALDAVSAHDELSRRYRPEVLAQLDLYNRSCFGVGLRETSAYAFLNFFCGEFGPIYSYPGGLGAITDALAKRLAGRIRTRARVTRVERDAEGVTVTYEGPSGARQLRARAAIVATPAFVTRQIVADLPREKAEALARVRYADYLVAGVGSRAPLWDRAYALWLHGRWATDCIDAGWVPRGGRRAPPGERALINLYVPLGRHPTKAMTEPDAALRARVRKDLEAVFPGASRRIETIRLARYAPAMHLAVPGFVTRTAPVLRRPVGRVYFAGVETMGLPCFESAVFSGYLAAQDARAALW